MSLRVIAAGSFVMTLLGSVSPVEARGHLEVDFSEGYEEGDVEGQQGGAGGPWGTTGPLYAVESAPDGRKALRISRHGTSQAHVPLITPLPTRQYNIYLAFDAFRANDRARGYWAPLAAPGSTPMGVGLAVRGDGRVELITGWKLERLTTEFIMQPGIWHRFELEINGPEGTMDVYVRVGTSGERLELGRQIPWETKNQTVRYFRIAQPDGGPESVLYTDRLIIHSDVAFPFEP